MRIQGGDLVIHITIQMRDHNSQVLWEKDQAQSLRDTDDLVSMAGALGQILRIVVEDTMPKPQKRVTIDERR
jgi:hypothetical protein